MPKASISVGNFGEGVQTVSETFVSGLWYQEDWEQYFIACISCASLPLHSLRNC
jgi:hypothetical protein